MHAYIHVTRMYADIQTCAHIHIRSHVHPSILPSILFIPPSFRDGSVTYLHNLCHCLVAGHECRTGASDPSWRPTSQNFQASFTTFCRTTLWFRIPCVTLVVGWTFTEPCIRTATTPFAPISRLVRPEPAAERVPGALSLLCA